MLMPLLILAGFLLLGACLARKLHPVSWGIYAGLCLLVMAFHAAVLYAAGWIGAEPSYSLTDLVLMRRFPMGGGLFYLAYAALFGCLGGLAVSSILGSRR